MTTNDTATVMVTMTASCKQSLPIPDPRLPVLPASWLGSGKWVVGV
jgi:hypothetical protein